MLEDAGQRRASALGLWVGYLPLVIVGGLVTAMVWIAPSDLPSGGGGNGGSAREVEEAQPASGWNESVTACTDRDKQVTADSYSPPCYQFTGDNGGATSRGVDADSITVSYRMTPDPNLFKVLADQYDVPFDETPEDLARTA